MRGSCVTVLKICVVFNSRYLKFVERVYGKRRWVGSEIWVRELIRWMVLVSYVLFCDTSILLKSFFFCYILLVNIF